MSQVGCACWLSWGEFPFVQAWCCGLWSGVGFTGLVCFCFVGMGLVGKWLAAVAWLFCWGGRGKSWGWSCVRVVLVVGWLFVLPGVLAGVVAGVVCTVVASVLVSCLFWFWGWCFWFEPRGVAWCFGWSSCPGEQVWLFWGMDWLLP